MEMFSIGHILIIVACMVLIVLLALLFRKLPFEKVIKILLYVGIVSEVIKVFSYIIANEEELGGYLPKSDLPFHLCSIQIIFIIILNITKKENIKKLLTSFMLPTCLIGGIAAIILATSSSRNMPVIGVQYFSYHTAISAFALYLFINKEIKFNFKDYIHTLIMLGALGMAAIYINSIVNDYLHSGINFMYVVKPPQDGLPFLNNDHGWLVYIVHYGILAVLVVSLCFIKPIINKIKHQEDENTENKEIIE